VEQSPVSLNRHKPRMTRASPRRTPAPGCPACRWGTATEAWLPVAFTVFPGEIFHAPHSWAGVTDLWDGILGWP